MDKLASIRAFTRVVAHGSYSQAARELRLSRSAVSKHVIDLEEALGVQLLNRTTRHVAPTENGQAYYDRCVAILADLEEADLAVSRLQAEPRGLLRVNAPMSFGTIHLGRALGAFMTANAGLQVQLNLSDELIDPVEGGYDVTLRIADLPSSSLVARRIAPVEVVLCAAPAYLADRGAPRHPDDLRDHDCLNYGNQATGNQWRLTGPDGAVHWVPVPWRLSCNNGDVLRDAAVGGCGIALLPTFILGDAVRRGALRTVLDGYAPPPRALHAIWPPNRHLSAKVRLFVDFLVARFGKAPHWDAG